MPGGIPGCCIGWPPGCGTATGAFIPRGGPPIGAPPAIGATPTIVPLRRFGTCAPAPAAPAGGGVDPDVPPPVRCVLGCGCCGGPTGTTPGWFIISIVPLNFGAATLLR